MYYAPYKNKTKASSLVQPKSRTIIKRLLTDLQPKYKEQDTLVNRLWSFHVYFDSFQTLVNPARLDP